MRYVKTNTSPYTVVTNGKPYEVKKTFSGFDYVMVDDDYWPMVIHSTQEEMNWVECDADGNELETK